MEYLDKITTQIWNFHKSRSGDEEQFIEEADFKINNQEIENISKKILNLPDDFLKNSGDSNNNKNFIKELEIFRTNDDSNDTFFSKIDRTQTIIGKLLLSDTIINPKTDIKLLENRKEILKFWTSPENRELLLETRKIIKDIAKQEEELYWIKTKITPEMENVVEMLYFTSFWNKWVNQKDEVIKWYYHFVILLYPICGVLFPLMLVVIPYVLFYLLFKIPVPLNVYFQIIKNFFFGGAGITGVINNVIKVLTHFIKNETFKTVMLAIVASSIISYIATGISVFSYFYSIYNNILVSISYNKVINLIHKRMNAIASLTTKLYEIEKNIGKFNSDELDYVLKGQNLCKSDELELLWEKTFNCYPNCFSNKGHILKEYWNLKNKTECLDTYFKYLAYLDVWTSIATLQLEGSDENNNHNHNHIWSIAEYSTENKPSVLLEDFTNIMVSKPIINTIQIGGKKENNVLITGANASGKSTCIKSIIEGILLAQTICIVPAKKCVITPFKLINTYLNIPDCQGKESLFQAEMSRCYNQINQLKSLKDGFALTVMDEIFVSTNYFEGMSGAYAISKKMATFPNSLCIITTHFPALAKICDKDDKFKTYYFPIKRENGKIIKTYKLVDGVNVEHLAIELLENKGFDKDVIQNAKKMYLSLINKKSKKSNKSNIKDNIKDNIKENILKDNLINENVLKDNLINENVLKDNLIK